MKSKVIYSASVVVQPDLDFSFGPRLSGKDETEDTVELPQGRKNVGGEEPKFYEIIRVKASDKKNQVQATVVETSSSASPADSASDSRDAPAKSGEK